MASNPAPSDSEAAAYYEAHTEDLPHAGQRARAPHPAQDRGGREEGARAREGEEGRADRAKLVTTWSQDTLTKTNAGDLGTVTTDGGSRSARSPRSRESAMALGTGGIGGPTRRTRAGTC